MTLYSLVTVKWPYCSGPHDVSHAGILVYFGIKITFLFIIGLKIIVHTIVH